MEETRSAKKKAWIIERQKAMKEDDSLNKCWLNFTVCGLRIMIPFATYQELKNSISIPYATN